MAKEPAWKAGKAQAPWVRVPCPPPIERTRESVFFLLAVEAWLEPERAGCVKKRLVPLPINTFGYII